MQGGAHPAAVLSDEAGRLQVEAVLVLEALGDPVALRRQFRVVQTGAQLV